MADRCEALISERGWGFWAVELKTSGSFPDVPQEGPALYDEAKVPVDGYYP